jgi:hypothetical protein
MKTFDSRRIHNLMDSVPQFTRFELTESEIWMNINRAENLICRIINLREFNRIS